MKKLIILGIFLGLMYDVFSQEAVELKERPFQFTFIPPVSTNGLESSQIRNNLSLNLFAGYQGALKGVEVGGFANILKYDMEGGQYAGFANITGGTAKGVQAAGFANINRKFSSGVRMAGFANVVGADAEDVQMAGFANITAGNHKGVGVAGFINTAKNHEGAQLAGFANVAAGELKGAQVSGFANVAKDVDGVQLSGFANIAKNVKGSQISVINIADSISGVPIGVLSLVKKGYKRGEIGSNEVFYVNASFKTGVSRFYNIFTAGTSLTKDNFNWGFGYGVGTEIAMAKNVLNIEIVSNQISEGDHWLNKLNQVNRLNVNIALPVSENSWVVVGPSFNVHVSEYIDPENKALKSDIAPYTFFKERYGNTWVQMWAGLNASFRF